MPRYFISVISAFYAAFRDNRIISLIMTGMLAGVAAVVTDVVISMAGTLVRDRNIISITVMILAFIALRLFSVNIIILIVLAGLIGYIRQRAGR